MTAMPRQPLERRLASAREAADVLGRGLFEDARAAGWLAPRCVKEAPRGPSRAFYSVSDIREVEERILAGQYPLPAHTKTNDQN